MSCDEKNLRKQRNKALERVQELNEEVRKIRDLCDQMYEALEDIAKGRLQCGYRYMERRAERAIKAYDEFKKGEGK